MGYQTTAVLTRTQAEKKYVELKNRLHAREYRAMAVALNDRDLGDALDDLNERACAAENETCYVNYRIGS